MKINISVIKQNTTGTESRRTSVFVSREDFKILADVDGTDDLPPLEDTVERTIENTQSKAAMTHTNQPQEEWLDILGRHFPISIKIQSYTVSFYKNISDIIKCHHRKWTAEKKDFRSWSWS